MMDYDEIIAQYLRRGFGSMNKNDFEVAIFSRLLGTTLKDCSDYEISRKLRIPQSKVKRLRYEASLHNDDLDYSALFQDVIKRAVIKSNGTKLQFRIADSSLRSYLDDCLKKGGRFFDSSFNSELVVIDSDDFIFLLDCLLPEKEKIQIVQEAETKTCDIDGERITFRYLLNKFLASVAEHSGERFVDLSLQGLKLFISNCLL